MAKYAERKALKYIRKCDQCQRFTPSIHQPGGILNPLSIPWPVALVGLRHCGTIFQGSGKQEISPGRHRLFYEVG